MLSDNQPTNALLSHYKPRQSPVAAASEPKKQIISDQIEPPKEVENKQSIQSKTETNLKSKKNNVSKREKRFTLILKIFNIVLGILLATFGIYCYYGVNDEDLKNFKLIGYIMPGYLTFSGLVIIAIQMRISFICRNMKFLYNYFGRGFFNIYVGIMPLTLLQNKQESKKTTSQTLQTVAIYILVSLMVFVGLLYISAKICCCAKQGSKIQKKRKQKDDSENKYSESDE